jgi:hypothetical protein
LKKLKNDYTASFTAPTSLIEQLDFMLTILRKKRSAFIRGLIEESIKSLKQEVIMCRDRDLDAYNRYVESEMPDQPSQEAECKMPKSSLQKKSKAESMTS